MQFDLFDPHRFSNIFSPTETTNLKEEPACRPGEIYYEPAEYCDEVKSSQYYAQRKPINEVYDY